ncbi:MAG: phenylalanine--tRNA ligase subunit alpha [bacterium]
MLALEEEAGKAVERARDLETLNQVRVEYLGRKGKLTGLLAQLPELSAEERPRIGKLGNSIKQNLQEKIKATEERIKQQELAAGLEKESIDVTLPGWGLPAGSIHPVSSVLEDMVDIFSGMGFWVEEGPDIETDYNNFEALNIGKDHPARDMQDTFYLSEDVVLRTHTSPVQVRTMQKYPPPVRIICPGRVYRCDSDLSHSPMFHQVEGLMVDRGISFGHLKGVLMAFLQEFFGREVGVRFRPSYFPFTEPSAEVDIECVMCKGEGCPVCKKTGWLEILGSGMVHPQVLKNVEYDPEEFTGFAFGFGVERLAMLRYKIDSIRTFFDNDLRFLRQF